MSEPITTQNWGYPPYNRVAFQNVQQLFPTARVRRGTISNPWRAPGNPLDLANIDYTGLDGASHSIAHMLETSYTDAFLVAQHGQLLHEEYANGMTPGSLHLLNSVTKSITGMTAVILMDRGLFGVDDLVAEHVPELAHGAFRHTQVRHLLDMTAAVQFGEDYTDADADFWHETAVVGWRPALRTPISKVSLLDYAATLTATDQNDGEHYHYRTVLTNVLGMVIERATHKPLQQVIETELWSRIQAEQDLLIVVDSLGFPYVGAGGNASARDLVRFGQLVAQRGELFGEQIIPARWIAETCAGNDLARTLMAASDYAEMMPGGHYQNQMWVKDPERGVLLAIGIHGQTIHIDLSNSVVIVKLSSHPEPADMALFGDTFQALDALSDTLSAAGEQHRENSTH